MNDIDTVSCKAYAARHNLPLGKVKAWAADGSLPARRMGRRRYLIYRWPERRQRDLADSDHPLHQEMLQRAAAARPKSAPA